MIFVRGTTEGINLVAQSYARPVLQPGDEVLISTWSITPTSCRGRWSANRPAPRSRSYPWMRMARCISMRGEAMMNPRTKMFACAHVSNALGTVLPVKRLVAAAKIPRHRDARRRRSGVPHMAVDVQDLGCDFYAFSGHKMYGPTGVGVLYGRESAAGAHAAVAGRRRDDPRRNLRENHLQRPAEQIRGRHARTFPAASASGPRWTSLRHWTAPPRTRMSTRTARVCHRRCVRIPGLRHRGHAADKTSLVSFVRSLGVHPHDLGTILDEEGVAVRTGHHCAMPVMDLLSRCPPPRAPRSPSTTPSRKSTGWPQASSARARDFP